MCILQKIKSQLPELINIKQIISLYFVIKKIFLVAIISTNTLKLEKNKFIQYCFILKHTWFMTDTDNIQRSLNIVLDYYYAKSLIVKFWTSVIYIIYIIMQTADLENIAYDEFIYEGFIYVKLIRVKSLYYEKNLP